MESTLKSLAESVKIVTAQGEAKLAWDKRDEWQQRATDWRCTLIYKGRRYSFDFWQGEAHTEAPTADGVLECLLSDASSGEESFEDFCGNMGESTDSRKAEQTWKACQRVAKSLKRLLGSDYKAFMYSDR